jgi:hypothetical protein
MLTTLPSSIAIAPRVAFAGSYAFPAIIDAFPVGPAQSSGPFWIGSGLAVLPAIVVYFMLDEIKPDHMTSKFINTHQR